MGVLERKVAIVTRGCCGIGREICTAFAKEGARIAIVDTDVAAANLIAAELESGGAEAIAIGCDMANGDDITQAVKEAVDWFGTVDILVNNPQTASHDVALQDMTDADFDLMLATGPTATFRFMRACHPYLANGGRVINVSSGAEVVAIPTSATREWGWYGITVSSLSPVVLDQAVFLAAPHAPFVTGCTMTAGGAESLVA